MVLKQTTARLKVQTKNDISFKAYLEKKKIRKKEGDSILWLFCRDVWVEFIFEYSACILFCRESERGDHQIGEGLAETRGTKKPSLHVPNV